VLPAVIFLDGDGNELGRYTNKNPDIASFRKTLRDVGEKRPL
jgi:hypothetical protein